MKRRLLVVLPYFGLVVNIANLANDIATSRYYLAILPFVTSVMLVWVILGIGKLRRKMRCAICDEEGSCGVNGVAFCLLHVEDGMRLALRGEAIVKGADPDIVEEWGMRITADMLRHRQEERDAAKRNTN